MTATIGPSSVGSSVATTRPSGLLRAAVAFAIAFSLHTFDHLRRGTALLTTLLQWAGNVSSVISVVTIVAVLTNRRWAPALATIAGFALAAGFAAAHLLPTWSDLSDSFPDQHVAVFSWIAATAEISTAAVLGITGLSAWRRNLSPSAPRPGDR